jgi:catechol 2,3-dioxygenase-like lactoylglutathione lyase family enzyme
MSAAAPSAPCRLARFSLVARRSEALVRFYEKAFGGCRAGSGRLDARQSERLLGVSGTTRYITVRLGAELIDFLQFEQPGRPYPLASSARDPLFQHFAIVVSEMGLALEQLCAIPGWSPITRDGPQRLPPSSGGATAFKFRDPAGHPLELLEFPPDKTPKKWKEGRGAIFLGIDHSAITVRDTATSERFYAGLGFTPSARSVNEGPEQEKLDDVPAAVVEVTALSSGDKGPHIELLRYRGMSRDTQNICRGNDVAATRLELACEALTALEQQNDNLLDPDGHHLTILNRQFSESGP